ncbi:MAG: hypothetical protein AAGA75_05795 [Cyanobacteria bacterium P01_E01_bin.6]
MTTKKVQYENLLADYSDRAGMIQLLKKFRPYLEMLPSMRRPDESLITIPLPLLRLREATKPMGMYAPSLSSGDVVRLPCDIGVIMCDPEWKIKTGVEIFVFIHYPHEDFSDLLGRWRQTQIWLAREYEWLLPHRYKHIFSEGADDTFALFVLLKDTPERIQKGLRGASLPFIIEPVHHHTNEEELEELSPELLWADVPVPNATDSDLTAS